MKSVAKLYLEYGLATTLICQTNALEYAGGWDTVGQQHRCNRQSIPQQIIS